MSIIIDDSYDIYSTSKLNTVFTSLNSNVFFDISSNFIIGSSNNNLYIHNNIIINNDININSNLFCNNLYNSNIISYNSIICNSNIFTLNKSIHKYFSLLFYLNDDIINNTNRISFLCDTTHNNYNGLFIVPFNGVYNINYLGCSDTSNSVFWINYNTIPHYHIYNSNCTIQFTKYFKLGEFIAFCCNGNIKKKLNNFITKANIILIS